MRAVFIFGQFDVVLGACRVFRSSAMSQTTYCYHCGVNHPTEQMRQIPTKAGPRWRCIKSIEATKKGTAAREAFGRQTTAGNKADMEAQQRRMANPEHHRTAK